VVAAGALRGDDLCDDEVKVIVVKPVCGGTQ
jgi:hypothetical protein